MFKKLLWILVETLDREMSNRAYVLFIKWANVPVIKKKKKTWNLFTNVRYQCMPIIPVLKEEDVKFKANMGYTVRVCL